MFIPLRSRALELTTPIPSSSSPTTEPHPEWLGWVAKPNLPHGRGTFDILLSCLFTIFICTWTIQHPMVPKRNEKFYWVSFRKIQMMAFTVIAPEMLIGAAIGEFWLAKASVKRNRTEISPQWTITHGFFALMGGFVVENRHQSPEFLRVNDEGIIALKKDGKHDLLPVLEAEINDRSKADILVKATACLQVLWLVIQCCARAQQNLPITPLELATVAFAGCSLVTYTAWFYKPQQVNETITILRGHRRKNLRSKVNAGWMEESKWPITERYRKSIVEAFEQKGRLGIFHYFAGHHAYSMKFSIAAGLLFGSIHIAAWNFAFPSTAERVLWRVAAVASTALPAALLLLLTLPDIVSNRFRNSFFRFRETLLGDETKRTGEGMGRAIAPLEHVIIVVYGTVRFYLLVAVFITFRSQPPEIYATVFWSKYIPHFT